MEGMKELFEKAEAENLVFRSKYQDLIFTPKELREKQDEGRYRWSSDNWELQSPESIIKEKEERINNMNKNLNRELEDFKKRVTPKPTVE